MTEKEFWSYSPRKLFALITEYNEINSDKKEEPEEISTEDLNKILMGL